MERSSAKHGKSLYSCPPKKKQNKKKKTWKIKTSAETPLAEKRKQTTFPPPFAASAPPRRIKQTQSLFLDLGLSRSHQRTLNPAPVKPPPPLPG
jgi:hypothetical protein